MEGRYKRSDGTLINVQRTTRKGRSYYEEAEVRGIGVNWTYHEVSESELKQRIKDKSIIATK